MVETRGGKLYKAALAAKQRGVQNGKASKAWGAYLKAKRRRAGTSTTTTTTKKKRSGSKKRKSTAWPYKDVPKTLGGQRRFCYTRRFKNRNNPLYVRKADYYNSCGYKKGRGTWSKEQRKAFLTQVRKLPNWKPQKGMKGMTYKRIGKALHKSYAT